MKRRLLVVWGAVVLAVAPRSGAGGVQPSAEPRFEVEGKRHRMVLPLSISPSSLPVIHVGLWAVDIVLPDLTPEAAGFHRPGSSANAMSAVGPGDVIIRPHGVSVHTRRRVERARSFVLANPTRLVVDVLMEQVGAGGNGRAGDEAAAITDTTDQSVPARDPFQPCVPVSVSAGTRVQPSGAPRFGVHGGRHRTVVPLSTVPSADPVVRAGVWTVDVALAGFEPGGAQASIHRPARRSGSASAIHETVIGPGGVSLRTNVAVGSVHAFVLKGPPRLVIDVEPGTVEAAVRGIGREPDCTEPEPNRVAATPVDTAMAPPETDAPPAVMQDAPLRLGAVGGYTMLWPNLDAPGYAMAASDAATAAVITTGRRVVGALRQGRAPEITVPLAPGVHTSDGDPYGLLPADAPPAAHALAGDLAYLHAATGDGDFAAAVALYRRAARLAPAFTDAGRVGLLLGFAQLAQGLAPEAEAEFERLASATGDPAVRALALLGAGRAARAAGRHRRAARQLRRAVAADPRSYGACHARSTLGILLAEAQRTELALALTDEMRRSCPADVVGQPAVLVDQAGILTAAGRLDEAEQLLAALPALKGDLFVRRRFLEAEVATAAGRLDVARGAYEEVRRRTRVPERVRAEATLRLAALEDRADRPDRARTLLRRLGREHRSTAIRARGRALEAEQLARRGRYPEAIHVLEELDPMGPAGFAIADRGRASIFHAWIRELAQRGDETEILTVFYRNRGDGIGRLLPPEDVLRVAGAASTLGLHALAVEILAPVHARLRGDARVEARRLVAAAAVARGEHAHAARLTEEVRRTEGSATTRAAMARLRAGALLRLGRVDEAVAILEQLGGRQTLVALGSASLHEAGDARRAVAVLTRALADAGAHAEVPRDAVLDGWLALAHAASQTDDPRLEAQALRAALDLDTGAGTDGLHYRFARVATAGARPGEAAAAYAGAARDEGDALFKRVAAAGAAYYEAVRAVGATP